MKNFKVILISLVLLTASCGKKDADPKNAQRPPETPAEKPELATMPLPEALIEKYDSIVLTCSLWTRMRGPLFITDTPDDTASFDLLKDFGFPKRMVLKAQSDAHSFDLTIELTEIKLVTTTYSDSFGARYELKDSPKISGTFSGQSVTRDANGSTAMLPNGQLTFNERIVNRLIAQSSGPIDSPKSVDYVECEFSTQVKSSYKEDWKQESEGNEPACLLMDNSVNDCMIRKN